MDAETVLSVDSIRKRYDDVVAVAGVSFVVSKGETLGLLGPNGAGKTTLIRILCGLMEPDGGNISRNGKIGFCPQETVIWDRLTCREQLVFLGQMHAMKAAPARRRAGELLDRMHLAPKGDTQASKLSGGMKRRLSILLALVHDPDLVILDEPETGLDPQSRILLREILAELAGAGKAVLVTTHNVLEAEKMARRICVMDQGAIIAMGSARELKERHLPGREEDADLEDVFFALTGRRMRD